MTYMPTLSTNCSSPPEELFDSLQASISDFIADNLHYQQRIIIRGGNQSRKFPTNNPDLRPREEACFPKGRVMLKYKEFCSSQKGVIYEKYPSFLLGRGSLEVWSQLPRPRQPDGWIFHFIFNDLPQVPEPQTYYIGAPGELKQFEMAVACDVDILPISSVMFKYVDSRAYSKLPLSKTNLVYTQRVHFSTTS